MRATAGVASGIFERYLGVPKPTSRDFAQRLRKDPDLLRPGRQGFGAPELTVSELSNWTIALCAATATTRKSPDAIQTVKLARAAVRLSEPDLDARCSPEALAGLAVGHAKTFGEAIDSLIVDMRSGAYKAWTCGQVHSLTIRFFNTGGRIVINLWRWVDDAAQTAVLVFRTDNHPADSGNSLTYIHELKGDALEALAATLDQPRPAGRDLFAGS
jgi:hypothetical protein